MVDGHARDTEPPRASSLPLHRHAQTTYLALSAALAPPLPPPLVQVAGHIGVSRAGNSRESSTRGREREEEDASVRGCYW